jgi:hypothetical protein
MEHLKRFIRYCRMDMVSTFFMLITLGLFIWIIMDRPGSETAGYWLGAVVLFAFNRIVWQGGLIDMINEYQEDVDRLTNENIKLKNQINYLTKNREL